VFYGFFFSKLQFVFFAALLAFALAAPKPAPQFYGLYGGYTGLGYGLGYASPYAYGTYGGLLY
jgi:hypothetical protein